MVQVDVTTSVVVKGTRFVTAQAALDPDSYHVAEASLQAVGAAGASVEVSLLPASGKVALLALTATRSDGKPATLTVTPVGTADGAVLTVTGNLLIANASVLAGLAAGGPRTLKLANKENAVVSVTALAAIDV